MDLSPPTRIGRYYNAPGLQIAVIGLGAISSIRGLHLLSDFAPRSLHFMRDPCAFERFSILSRSTFPTSGARQLCLEASC